MSDSILSKLSAMTIILFELCGVAASSHMCLLSTWNMSWMNEELNFKFWLMLIKLKRSFGATGSLNWAALHILLSVLSVMDLNSAGLNEFLNFSALTLQFLIYINKVHTSLFPEAELLWGLNVITQAVYIREHLMHNNHKINALHCFYY